MHQTNVKNPEMPQTCMCTYRVKRDQERPFIQLLERHWPTLRRAGLVTDQPPQIFRGQDDKERPFFVEIFSWKDASAPETAHHSPEIMAVWEPMGALVEERDGRPSMEFPQVEPLNLQLAR
jgi:hypothetical protein